MRDIYSLKRNFIHAKMIIEQGSVLFMWVRQRVILALIAIVGILFALLILESCTVKPLSTETQTANPLSPTISNEKQSTPSPIAPQLASGKELFLDAGSFSATPNTSTAKRYRFVKLNQELLLDESGIQKSTAAGSELNVNLFSDTNYIGVIDSSGEDSTGFYWYGHLKEVEYSTLTIVYTGDVFIFKFASPAGVYEVSYLHGEIYQIIEVDQNSVPGKEG